MSNGDKQIVDCYESLGLSPEDIVENLSTESFKLDLALVKQVLMQNSAKFRRNLNDAAKAGVKHPDDFTDDEFEIVRKRILDLTKSPIDGVALKASMFIFNEKKGRNDIEKQGNTTVNNVKITNIRIERAIKATTRATLTDIPIQDAIEVKETIQNLQPA